MKAVKNITNVIVIGGAGYVGYQAFKQIQAGIKSKNTMGIAMAGVMLLVGVAAIRHSLNKLSE